MNLDDITIRQVREFQTHLKKVAPVTQLTKWKMEVSKFAAENSMDEREVIMMAHIHLPEYGDIE